MLSCIIDCSLNNQHCCGFIDYADIVAFKNGVSTWLLHSYAGQCPWSVTKVELLTEAISCFNEATCSARCATAAARRWLDCQAAVLHSSKTHPVISTCVMNMSNILAFILVHFWRWYYRKMSHMTRRPLPVGSRQCEHSATAPTSSSTCTLIFSTPGMSGTAGAGIPTNWWLLGEWKRFSWTWRGSGVSNLSCCDCFFF